MAAGMGSTGPVDAWVSTPGAGIGNGSPTPHFLGHCEDGFSIDWLREYAEHMNDLAGLKIPYDRSRQGMEAVASGVLTRLDWEVLMLLDVTTTFGTDLPGDRGTLLMTEGMGSILWLRFPYAKKFPSIGLVNGLRFPCVRLSKETWKDLKPGAVAAPVTFAAQSQFDPTFVSPSGLGWGKWTLCDFDMTALPAAGS